MTDLTYRQFRSKAFQYYNRQQYDLCLEYLNTYAHQYPYFSPQIENWRMCVLNQLGQSDGALDVFERYLAEGGWWPEDLLREDPDLQSLQGNVRFEQMVQVSIDRFLASKENSQPEIIKIEPHSGAGQPFPLLLFMHSRNGSAVEFQPYWEPLAERGWLVALVQSSEVHLPNGYVWDDLTRSLQEIRDWESQLRMDYEVDLQRVLYAGFSQGGGLAIRMALDPTWIGKHFLVVGPYLAGALELRDHYSTYPADRTRGVMVLGGQDAIGENFTGIKALVTSCGAVFQKIEYPELGHEFPPDFNENLDSYLQYIFDTK